MRIGIMSGKGGTGKTTIAVNIAQMIGAVYVDCDVEEPNGFIFLKPEKIESKPVYMLNPEIDKDRCSGCGKCAAVCKFNALMQIGKNIMLFPKLCHGCGACTIVCERKAIKYVNREIGVIQKGKVIKDEQEELAYRGILNTGEPMAVPVINDLLDRVSIYEQEKVSIIDCAPGTSCNLVNTLEYVDFAVVVSEPSLYSLSDMDRTIKVLKKKNIKFGVVINKAQKEINIIEEYCKNKGIAIIGEIPFSRDIAEKYSTGDSIYSTPECEKILGDIKEKIIEMCKENVYGISSS